MKPLPVLEPISWLYGCGVVMRNVLYDRGFLHAEHVEVPVLSVGNITTGGTGKTPVVESIAKTFLKHGVRPAVVSRGYKRRTRGLVEVSDGAVVKTTAAECGDEPFLLATRIPRTVVVVDEQRVRGARYAAQKLGAQVMILDDGFQHRALYRNLNIVLIDASHPPFGMSMLPAGHRREPLRSLKRADVILLTKVTPASDSEAIKKRTEKYSAARFFTSSYSVASFRRAKTGFSLDLSGVKGKNAIAFC